MRTGIVLYFYSLSDLMQIIWNKSIDSLDLFGIIRLMVVGAK